MDNKTNANQEAPPSGNDLSNEKAPFAAGGVTKIKNETTTSVYEFEIDTKINIKVEATASDVSLQYKIQSFSKNLERDFTNDVRSPSILDFEIYSKSIIKEEPVFTVAEIANVTDLDCTSLGTKINNDDIKGNNIRMDSKTECSTEELISLASSQNDVISINGNVETITKTEIDCQSQGAFVPDISQATENEHAYSDLEVAEVSSESLRCIAEAVNCDVSSDTFPDVSDFETASETNIDKEISMDNICSHDCDPLCDSEYFDSGEDVGGESKLICNKNISSQKALNSLCYSEQKSYKCEICEKCFTKKCSLNRHELLHSGIKPYKCEHCEKYFTRKEHLKGHSLLHSGTKSYKCENCEKCFTRKSALNRHRLLHLSTPPYKCEQCDKHFTLKSQLEGHMLLHSGKTPHKCGQCGKCFALREYLNSHILVHTSTKPYKCDHCEKSFIWKSTFKRHTSVHSSTKPYKCEYCEKCFANKARLKSHTVLHKGTKAYKCEHCGKCFTWKSGLNRHILIH